MTNNQMEQGACYGELKPRADNSIWYLAMDLDLNHLLYLDLLLDHDLGLAHYQDLDHDHDILLIYYKEI